MNGAYDIIKILERAGLHVKGADTDFIYIEDPGCILRGFQNFLENAWLVFAALTVFLVMLWGISMITGAKNDIKNNFKTVVLILGILTVTGPILNVIYGGDLFGAGCGEIRVKTSEVNAIVSARADTNSDINLYEDINIYNPGAIPIYIPELPDPGVSGLDEESSNQ